MASPVAERPAEALWLAALPTPAVSPASDPRLPVTPGPAPSPALGTISGLPGAVTDLALSADGRSLVAAHYGDDAVSVIDVTTLAVTASVAGIPEPYALSVADRVYVSSAGIAEDSAIAVDTASGVALAAKPIPASARGLAISPGGDVLYVARCVDDVADIAVIAVESGEVATIPIARGEGVTVDTVRINADGTRLYAALTTDSGGALLVIDTGTHSISQQIPLNGPVGDIAVHRDSRRVFITGWSEDLGGVLAVLDTDSGRVDVVDIDGLATQVALGPSHAYVVHGDGETGGIAVINSTGQTVERIDIGRPVSCVTLNRDGSRLYIADYDGGVTVKATGTTGTRLRAVS
jgi:YVTN family beta-propeller protein